MYFCDIIELNQLYVRIYNKMDEKKERYVKNTFSIKNLYR